MTKAKKEDLAKDLANKTIDPKEYFAKVKSMKHRTDKKFLENLHKNSNVLLQKAYKLGQETAIRKLLFSIDVITKEKFLLGKGFDTFVYKDDIDSFLGMVANKSVKIIELSRYPREIPDEIANKILSLQDDKIFDEYFIVFTDYTDEIGKEVKAEKRRKDPIIFGTFIKDINISDRFYYIGDWEDEYCDLTLDKMVSKMSEKGKEIKHTINIEEASTDEIREYVANLDEKQNNRFVIGAKPKKPFFKKVKLWTKK